MRRWREEDRVPFAEMNADPAVMEFFPTQSSAEESHAFVDRIEACFEERGYGLWAIELPGIAEFIGYTGLWPVPDDLPFAPAVEVGWRLKADRWGQGYATEGARAALAYGFENCGMQEIVSFATCLNLRSISVMVKAGLTRDLSGDFDHPRIAAGHRLRPHVTYRIDNPALRQANLR